MGKILLVLCVLDIVLIFPLGISISEGTWEKTRTAEGGESYGVPTCTVAIRSDGNEIAISAITFPEKAGS